MFIMRYACTRTRATSRACDAESAAGRINNPISSCMVEQARMSPHAQIYVEVIPLTAVLVVIGEYSQ